MSDLPDETTPSPVLDKHRYSPDLMRLVDDKGNLPSHAWPGGYPLFYLCADNGVLCPKCANQKDVDFNDPHDKQWHIVAHDVNWEDENLICDHCNGKIESAYGDPEKEE